MPFQTVPALNKSCIIEDVWEMGKNHPKMYNIFARGSGLILDVWTERKKYQQINFFTILNPHKGEQESKQN